MSLERGTKSEPNLYEVWTKQGPSATKLPILRPAHQNSPNLFTGFGMGKIGETSEIKNREQILTNIWMKHEPNRDLSNQITDLPTGAPKITQPLH